MAEKITREDGTEVELYTAEEVQAREVAAGAAKEKEFTPIKTKLESDLEETRKALGERSGEFKQFRTLNEATVAKLTVAERTIYENSLQLKEEQDKRAELEKTAREKSIESAIRSKAGTDEKLFTKIKDMWSVIGIEANTAEEMEVKTKMIIGALGVTQPDLVANVNGFQGGSFAPPRPTGAAEGDSFANTDGGKRLGAELGLTLEIPKK